MSSDPYRYFRLEARELLDQLSAGVLELEKSENTAEAVQRLFRLAHTLKGAARVVKQSAIADRAHALEDALSPFRDGTAEIPVGVVQTILGYLDAIAGAMKKLAPAPLPVSAATATAQEPSAPDQTVRTVRNDIAELDALLDGMSEAHRLLARLRETSALADRARHLADLLVEQLAARGTAHSVRQAPVDLDQARRIGDELRTRLGVLDRELGACSEQIDREFEQLRDAAEQLRLVRTEILFGALQRTARDASEALGRQLSFSSIGADIRLDSYVLTTVQKALVQLVRNAVAHGIEPEAERLSSGKPRTGSVTVSAVRRGRNIVFECRDDGRGLEMEAIRRVAREKGMAGTEALDDEALIRVLLRGGISTSPSVTEVAGRGVGLDVVRAAIEQLGGVVAVRTERGKGTTFELTVPLSLAAMDVLEIEDEGNAMAIPLDAVETTLRIPAEQISWDATGAAVIYGEAAIPFHPLSALLSGRRPRPRKNWSAIVLKGTAGQVAIGIDRLLGAARAVVRPLPDQMEASAIVAGATLSSGGNPQLVLDPDGLAATVRREGAVPSEDVAPSVPILVIDDSLTTRMLEQSILESAGYDVDVAVSAEDGLESARRKRYALFLVDVEMPGIDGFTFVERIRADPDLRGTPAILVTSRAAPEDLRRGREAGAQGYIIKGEFDQTELLDMIRQLVA